MNGALVVEDLRVAFGGVRAVRGVGFAVAEGEVRGLIGPNGAGKTTVINCLSGHLRPDSGSIAWRGTELARLPAHRIARLGVGRTFQNLRLFRDLTVLDNVLVGLHRRFRTGSLRLLIGGDASEERALRADAARLLEAAGIPSALWGRDASALAYGLQRMLEIARALAGEPRLLLLDEPAAGMNPDERRALLATIGTIRAGGTTILLVEHDMDVLMAAVDRVTVMHHGDVLAEGTPAEVRADARVVDVYLGTAP